MNASSVKLRAPSIEELKARYTVADAWRDEGFQGTPNRSCHSPFRDDRHHSFSVYAEDRKWKDHATGDGGDVLDFIAKARACSAAEALAIVRERVGWEPQTHGPAVSRREVKPQPKVNDTPSYRTEPMDTETAAAWSGGIHWLKIDDDLQREVDRWRGWPLGTTRFLATQGLLGSPEMKGRRGLAFLMQYPGRTSWVEIGFHMRHKPRREGDRVVWTYHPAGRGMPAVPLVLGNFYGARLVVVCEGEWDACTFAAAAGWLENVTAWPDGFAVVGIRGATGWRTFLEHWRRAWPRKPRFLLIPDNDEAGMAWQRDFVNALTPLALSVTVLPPKIGGPKDFNDLHRVQPFTRSSIYGILNALNLVDEKGFPK